MGKALEEVAAELREPFGRPKKGGDSHDHYVLRSDEYGGPSFELDEVDMEFVGVLWSENPAVHRFALDPKTALLRYRWLRTSFWQGSQICRKALNVRGAVSCWGGRKLGEAQ
jgi:hypothetical protein